MKALALEYIINWIILLSLAFIVISLMLFYSDEIKKIILKETRGKEVKYQEISKEFFSSGEILAYALSCWEKTGESYKEDAICYYLKGDMSNVNPNWIKDEFEKRYPNPPPFINLENFNVMKNIAIIKFKEFRKEIIIEN